MQSFSLDKLALGVLWYLVFVFSTVVHEAAHALAAKMGGDDTAFRGGQVTLDPMPHIRREPFGMVLVPLLTYFMGGWMMGWASAPYNPQWANRYPRRAAWMSLAGPGANLSLVIIAGVSIRIGILLNIFQPPSRISFTNLVAAAPGQAQFISVLAMFVSITFMLNLILGFFNLMPVPPLDGSTGITLFMNRDLMNRWYQLTRQPLVALIGFIFIWRVFGSILAPILSMALKVLYPDIAYR